MFRLQQTAMGFGQLLVENDPNFNQTTNTATTEEVTETEEVTQPEGDNNE